jgi:signal transduction histidine kinase/ligand-binding sensor domain-containing protein
MAEPPSFDILGKELSIFKTDRDKIGSTVSFSRKHKGKPMQARKQITILSLLMLLNTIAITPFPTLGAGESTIRQSIKNQTTGIDVDPENINFERVQLPGGLTSKIIQSIAQDQQGFIWLGTEGGLYKYDGYEFTTYQQEASATPSYPNDIEIVFIDSQNRIWVGTPDGLFRYDRKENSFENFHNEFIITIYEDSQGVLWVSASDNMYQFDTENDELALWAFANFGVVTAIHESKDGMLWFGTTKGLFRYDAGKPAGKNVKQYQHSLQNATSISGNYITDIAEDLSGNLWVGTNNNGINRLSLPEQDNGIFEHFVHNLENENSISSDTITSLSTDHSGNLWVGTLNGLNLYVPDGNDFISLSTGAFEQFFSGIIMDLFVDYSGLLWVGSIGALDKLNITSNRFVPFMNPTLQEQIILSGFEEQNGDQWFGTFQDGLYKFSSDSTLLEHYQHDSNDPSSLSHNSVRAVYRDSRDILWVGTENGLNIFDPETKGFTQDPRFSGHQITIIFEDPTERLWIGTSHGLFNSLRTIRRFSRLRDEYITDIEAAENGNVWLGTIDGLYLVNPAGQSIAHYNYETPHMLANDWVNEIYKDENGILWIGTGEGGIEHFDPATETFIHYTKENGLISDTVYCIQGDLKGNLWIGTDLGVTKFDRKSEYFYNYDMTDGLSGNEVIGCGPTRDGTIIFTSLQGVNYIRSGDIQNNQHTPPILITAFKKFNQTVKTDLANNDVIQLRHDDNFISFEFAALDYVHPEKNQYAYKMEGLDEEWVYAENRRYAEYPDLRPGEYTFRVIGSNNDGIWNETGTAIHIKVKPAFWQTWWFWSLVGIAIVGAIYSGYRLRVRSLQLRSRELEEQVAIRTREIDQRRQEIEALYRADEELHSHLELDQVLLALVETAIDILKADKGTLLVWDEARNNLTVRVSRGFSADTLRLISFAPGQGVAGQVGTTGKPAIIEDTFTDPRVTQEIVQAEGIRSFMQVPITIDDEIFGVFSADFTQPHPFSEDEKRLLISLAQRAALAIENAHLYEQAQDLGVLQERNRLARDLHDSVTQSMYSVTMFADAASKHLADQQPKAAANNLNKLRHVIKEAIHDLRLLIFELRPQILQKEGLTAAIEARLEAVENRSGVQIDYEVEGESHLAFHQEDGFYRIALEAMTNALKHAKADKIQIKLQFEKNIALMKIQDNGIGFDLASAQESGGMGIPGMLERAGEMGAEFQIESHPGNGTRVITKVKI